MTWDVETVDEFDEWFNGLTRAERKPIAAMLDYLSIAGPQMPFPLSSDIRGSRHSHMRELRIQHKGRPLRILYAFDPRRTAILLLGGDKTGSTRWYVRNVPLADERYDRHLKKLREKGVI